jgi:copper resistance protein B
MKALLALPLVALFASPALAQQQGQMDQKSMDHGQMDHDSMDHGSKTDDGKKPMKGKMKMDDKEAKIPQSPPPAAAFEGPLHAADAYVGKAVMDKSRAKVVRQIAGLPVFWLMGDRLEYRARSGKDGYLWDVTAAYGGNIDKLWLRSEGEGNFGEKPESADIRALWSHAIGPWWDLQLGARQSLVGPERTYAVVGVEGLAPYMFEVNGAAYLSQKGELTARIEGELDQRITQRLILQPRGEVKFSVQDIPELGIGAGIDTIEAGLRLRYEIKREFAPYIGVAQEWKVGQSADYARAAGEDPSTTNFVAGVRFWF